MKIIQIMCLTWFLMSLPGTSKALRCGTDLVHEGDVLYHVQKKCGEPDDEFVYHAPLKLSSITLDAGGERSIIIWTYDKSRSSGVLHRLRFENGVLTKITSIRR